MVNPKTPTGKGWQKMPAFLAPKGLTPWLHESGIYVLSGVDTYADSGVSFPDQFHISVTFSGRRCNDDQIKMALKDFDMLGAEEDNLPFSQVRNFFKNAVAVH